MLDYQSKEWPVCVPSYFLEPQFEYIGQYHTKRIQPYLNKINRVPKELNEGDSK